MSSKDMELIEEGVEYLYGTIAPGALTWGEDNTVPLTWNADHARPPIGKVTNLRREGNKIMGMVEVFEEQAESGMYQVLTKGLFSDSPFYYPGPFVKPVTSKDRNHLGGEIRCIDVFPNHKYPALGTNPGAEIQ